MNILLIALAMIMIWRITAGVKRGVVREIIALVNIIFAVLVLGLCSMIYNAYNEKNYIAIAVMVVVIAVISAVYSVLKLVLFPAKVVTKLPVVSGADKLLGVIFGVAETVVIFWGFAYAMRYIDFGGWNAKLLEQIGQSRLLTMMYQYNFLGGLLEMLHGRIMLLETIKEKTTFLGLLKD